jgi:beta-glucosidase
MTNFIKFPNDFKWGTATAAYQIEGGVKEDGRGLSIWDVFAHTPGKIANNDNGDIACDHYHLWREDVELLKNLGIQNYRFSISWPRILPEGKGKVNQKGLDFYSRLIDELLSANITPMITLYHWDIPASLAQGWLDRSVLEAFSQFSDVTSKAFGDRVKQWVTINEPFCPSLVSYKMGEHAPGEKNYTKALIAAHHLLLAHGRAVPIIRENVKGAKVGICLNSGPLHSKDRSFANLEAVRFADGQLNRWFMDPLYGRHYPMDMLQDFVKMGVLGGIEPEFIQPADFEDIATPTDFLALNYYTRNTVIAGNQQESDPSSATYLPAPKEIQTDMGWEVYPDGLFETLSRVHWEYKPGEIIITENGASYSDGPTADGRVQDSKRIDYLRGHFLAMARAIQSGVPLTGYYLWSLLDNFEWSHGYSQRFGIVYVDFKTLKRVPKDSAYWYQKVIQEHGLSEV